MNVTVYTGAGISAESGVPTFRDNSETDALWSQYDPGIVSTVGGWDKNLEMFQGFWEMAREACEKGTYDGKLIGPNAAHYELARWENIVLDKGGVFNLITTNVDNLHERAGNYNPIKIHGDIMQDGRMLPNGYVMPDIVLFGDYKRMEQRMHDAIAISDIFVVIGSSLSTGDDAAVYQAKQSGALTIEVNPNPTGCRHYDEVVMSNAVEGVPMVWDKYIAPRVKEWSSI